MKTIRFTLTSVAVITALGLSVFLSKCKKEPPIVVHTYTISGLCTYPDYTNTMVPAKGATLKIFAGTDPGVVATTFSDSTGHYNFARLLPGAYIIVASYNTDNQNKMNPPIQGINFAATVNVTLGTTNLTQNVALATFVASGALKISLDTIAAGAAYRKVTLESHSKTPWLTQHNGTQEALAGGFNVFKFTKFIFDEATPANITMSCYVQTSSVNTFEPTREILGSGCVKKTLNVDTTNIGGVIAPIAKTDTITFYANPGSVVKYGKGYLAHGHIKGFYKHNYGETGPGGSGANHYLPADTTYLQAADGVAYDQAIDKPVDMYFEYQSKIKQMAAAPSTNFNWMFTFEGKFTINIWTMFYIKGAPISNTIDVTPHVTFQGTTNNPY